MADNLTVGSPGAGNVAPGEAPKQERVDDGRAELDRLRSIAKERTGRNLDDKTLNAIVERRKTKLAQEGQLKETKQSFETGRAKEALTNKADEAQTRAAKTTGTQETKTADGLTERDRTAVRSDPKAGPRLPPADAKATTPEQAKELVGKLLESFLQQDGQPLDPKAYGATLKQRPPSQPRNAGQTRAPATTLGKESSGLQTGGKQSTQQASTMRGQPPASPSQLGTLGQSRSALSSTAADAPPPAQTPTGGAQAPGTQPRTQARQPGGTPGQAARPGALSAEVSTPRGGLGAPAGGTSLSFRAGAGLGLSTSTGVSPAGLFNAGGGLETHSSFDGMHFNWDGFFALFLIRSTKDMQEWRKLMKELRQMEGKAAIAAHATMIALTKMRQKFAREASVSEFTDALGKIPEKMKEGEVNAVLRGTNPARAEKDRKKLEQLVTSQRKSNPEFARGSAEGQVYLTETQIKMIRPPEQQQQYRDAMKDYKTYGSPLSFAGLVSDAAARTSRGANGARDPDLDPVNAALVEDAAAANRQVSLTVGSLMRDPRAAALLNRGRQGLRLKEQEAMKQREALDTVPPNETPDAKETRVGKMEPAERERAGYLRQIAVLDRAMANNEPDRPLTFMGALTRGGPNQTPAVDANGAPQQSDRSKSYEAAYADLQQQAASTKDAELNRALPYQRSLIDRTAPPEEFQKAIDYPNDDKATIDRLSAAVRGGDKIAERRADLYHNLKYESLLQNVGDAARSIGNDPNLIRAVDNAVSGAIATAKKNRGETDALMRETVARAQGMIGQLIQLLGMSRSH